MGAGCGQKPHRAQVSSLGQKGQEERRATGKGEGWRKDGELRPRSSERRLVRPPALPVLRRATTFSASNGPGAGRSPPPSSEVAGILTQEVSAQAQPPQRQHREPHLSPRPARTPPQVPEGRGGRAIPVGSRRQAGRWSGQREKITTFLHVPGGSPASPGCLV